MTAVPMEGAGSPAPYPISFTVDYPDSAEQAYDVLSAGPGDPIAIVLDWSPTPGGRPVTTAGPSWWPPPACCSPLRCS